MGFTEDVGKKWGKLMRREKGGGLVAVHGGGERKMGGIYCERKKNSEIKAEKY